MSRAPRSTSAAATTPPVTGIPEEAADPAAALVAAITLLVRAALGRTSEPSTTTGASEPWLTTAEGARHASVSEETLREWITLGMLPAGRCGRVLRVRRSDIDVLLLERGRVTLAEGEAAGEPTGRAREILSDLGRRNGTKSGG